MNKERRRLAHDNTVAKPACIDTGEIAERLLAALRIRSKLLQKAVAKVEKATSVAGPAAVINVLAEEAGFSRSQARHLIVILRALNRRSSGAASGGHR